jgi:glycosyltransferase involved in cell wall biosynthesis
MKFNDEPHLVFRGFVKDLEKEFSESNFAIVPPGYPTGFRTKISEAYTYGLPVITGKDDGYGVGLNMDDLRVIITDNSQAYADACVRLIQNKELRWKMGEIVFNTWREDYDSEKAIHDTANWIRDNI